MIIHFFFIFSMFARKKEQQMPSTEHPLTALSACLPITSFNLPSRCYITSCYKFIINKKINIPKRGAIIFLLGYTKCKV